MTSVRYIVFEGTEKCSLVTIQFSFCRWHLWLPSEQMLRVIQVAEVTTVVMQNSTQRKFQVKCFSVKFTSFNKTKIRYVQQRKLCICSLLCLRENLAALNCQTRWLQSFVIVNNHLGPAKEGEMVKSSRSNTSISSF